MVPGSRGSSGGLKDSSGRATDGKAESHAESLAKRRASQRQVAMADAKKHGIEVEIDEEGRPKLRKGESFASSMGFHQESDVGSDSKKGSSKEDQSGFHQESEVGSDSKKGGSKEDQDGEARPETIIEEDPRPHTPKHEWSISIPHTPPAGQEQEKVPSEADIPYVVQHLQPVLPLAWNGSSPEGWAETDW